MTVVTIIYHDVNQGYAKWFRGYILDFTNHSTQNFERQNLALRCIIHLHFLSCFSSATSRLWPSLQLCSNLLNNVETQLWKPSKLVSCDFGAPMRMPPPPPPPSRIIWGPNLTLFWGPPCWARIRTRIGAKANA